MAMARVSNILNNDPLVREASLYSGIFCHPFRMPTMLVAPRKHTDFPGQFLPPAASSTSQSEHDSDALDEALLESFPASDPIAVNITRIDIDQ